MTPILYTVIYLIVFTLVLTTCAYRIVFVTKEVNDKGIISLSLISIVSVAFYSISMYLLFL